MRQMVYLDGHKRVVDGDDLQDACMNYVRGLTLNAIREHGEFVFETEDAVVTVTLDYDMTSKIEPAP